ncbi:MAG TPA: ribulose-phosphate 3-epimerase [Chloroflexota bacterium]|nr:ribulose-phosphate 3-epimerase [Chloroflexota bacterium]
MAAYQIAPSVLAADFGHMARAAQEAEQAGAGAVHVDVMDGHFVPEISFGRRMVEALRAATTLPLDVHLMVRHPARHVEPFIASGATALTLHAEAAPHDALPGLLRAIRAAGARAGLALKPATDPDLLAGLFPLLDQVLVMTVEPGYSGQPFQPQMLPKLSAIAGQAPATVTLAVDGGIDEHTIKRCADAGATFFVAGSSVYSPRRSVAEGVKALRLALGQRT